MSTIKDHFQQATINPWDSQAVTIQVEYAKLSKLVSGEIKVHPKYQYSQCNKEQLVALYKSCLALHKQSKYEEVMNYHLFDLEDHILRLVSQDVGLGHAYQDLLGDLPLSKKIDKAITEPSRFFDLEPIQGKKIHTIADYQIKQSQVSKPNTDQPARVLKMCVESAKNPIGGVFAVVSGLRNAYKKLQSEKVYSIHPLYEKDKKLARDYTFQGVITHQYEGKIVRSSVYKNRQDKEYVVQPDPQFRHLFNITKGGVYDDATNGTSTDRLCYLASATAAFSTLYRGKSGDKSVDIIQSEDSRGGGCVFSVLRDIYNSMRQRVQLTTPKTVQVMHNGDLTVKMPCFTERLSGIGVNTRNEYWYTNLLEKGVSLADKVVFVSSEQASRAITQDSRVSANFDQLLQKEGKVVSILNGIDSEKFDVTNQQVFKDLALKRTFSADGIETTDYMAHRRMLKEILFNEGLIADPNLPLVLYVGRYASEKGVDILTDVISRSKCKDAQFVTMGVNYGQGSYLDKLKKLERTSHEKFLRVYTALSDQTDLFKNYGVTKGQLMRAAADSVIVPSHVESCGLVAMEAQCSGAPVIAPYHQGLKDICKSVKTGSDLRKDANAFSYLDHTNSKQAIIAFKSFVASFKDMSEEERNQLARRLRNNAVSNYSWYHKDENENIISGAAVAYHELYKGMTDKKSPLISEKMQAPIQAPIKPYRTFSSVVTRSVRQTVKGFFGGFSRLSFGIYMTVKRLFVHIK